MIDATKIADNTLCETVSSIIEDIEVLGTLKMGSSEYNGLADDLLVRIDGLGSANYEIISKLINMFNDALLGAPVAA